MLHRDSDTIRRSRRASPRRGENRFLLEVLECRELLSTWTMNATTDTGAGSIANRTGDLRFCVAEANADATTPRVIDFAIAGNGLQTINLGSPLPTISSAVLIDGTTQPDYSGTPLIDLNCSALTSSESALTVAAGNTTIRALVINNCPGTAITLQTEGADTVAGCFIGTTADGTTAAANGVGIDISSSSNDTIGGTVSGAGNLISGNVSDGIALGDGDNTLMQGNYIGTDVTGRKALGNGIGLLWSGASYATIGGTTAAARNIISGNTNGGMNSFVLGSGYEVIQGNYVGVDVTGVNALPNEGGGIRIAGPTNNTIGGTVAGAGNVISANTGDGIDFTVGPADGTVVEGNFIGTDATGTLNLGNSGEGVNLWSNNVTIGGTVAGAGNIIADNKSNGIGFTFNDYNDAILSNSIYDNGGLGINFGNGPTPNHPWPPGVTAGSGRTISRTTRF